LARGRSRAIGDHVRGHRRARRAVALVDVLDDFFALVTAGEVEIDVGPRLVPGRIGALLGKEALEEETHPDRIDRRDAQRVTDRAVGGRAAALGEDAVLLAEE